VIARTARKEYCRRSTGRIGLNRIEEGHMGSPSITEQAERPYISIEHLPHLPDPHLHAWTAVADIRLRSPPARPSATGRRPAWLMVLSVMLWSGAFGILTGLTSPAAQAQQTAATLFQGVRIFDGQSWSVSLSGAFPVHALWGVSPQNLVATGWRGALIRRAPPIVTL